MSSSGKKFTRSSQLPERSSPKPLLRIEVSIAPRKREKSLDLLYLVEKASP